ncbi:hypothetical protein [Rhodoblastus sp.]|jgi:hypothetical protein|uniref:hypothetical protein n=1 Tax=Rhodoblastus sp. TaxID=1962975 RepID=UPI00263400E7|nr:hypothetical protein [Rhodoblastus sp.]
MLKRFMAVVAALFLAFSAPGPAFALSRLTVHRGHGVPLPFFVTSNRYWLYTGHIRKPRRVYANDDYVRLVAEPVGDIVPVGPDLGFPW